MGVVAPAAAVAGVTSVGAATALALVGVGLLLVGFGFKIASVPFHMWAPDAYEGAPTTVTALMAAGVKAAAFGAFLRVFVQALPSLAAHWQPAVAVLAIRFKGSPDKRTAQLLAIAGLLFLTLVWLILTAPLMLLAVIAIRLESPGPVIYRQPRVGLGGRIFMCMKLRSMRLDAESDGIPRWAQRSDPRITFVGAFIRKTRIDELPQLLSVLTGQMSLVGPRPERPSFVDQLKTSIPFYDLRHSVKPGITGWAQVRYHYGGSLEDARRKHQFDLYYVKHNSLLLDMLVLLETVSVVLFHEGQ